MIRETIAECCRGYPDAPLVMEGFAYTYAAKMTEKNPKFRSKAFLRRSQFNPQQ